MAGSTGVANDEQGLAGALVNATRQLGAAIGAALLLSLAGSGSGSKAQLAASYRNGLAFAAGIMVVGALVALGLSGHSASRHLRLATAGAMVL